MEGIIPCQATEKRSIRKRNDRRGKHLLKTYSLLYASSMLPLDACYGKQRVFPPLPNKVEGEDAI